MEKPDQECDGSETPQPESLKIKKQKRALTEGIKNMGIDFKDLIDELDPLMERIFRNRMRLFEDLDKQPKAEVKSLFEEGFEFPPSSNLSNSQITDLLQKIYGVLEENGICFDLCPNLPERMVYEYFISHVLKMRLVLLEAPILFNEMITGCSGQCEDCFQKEYCHLTE